MRARRTFLLDQQAGVRRRGHRRRGRDAAVLSVVGDEGRSELVVDLDELVREGARRMLAVALEEEVAAYIAAHAGELDDHGHRLVRRNGHARKRVLITGAGQVPVTAPRVDDRRIDPATGTKARFRSAIMPPWCRKSPKVTEMLPLLYLHGMSSGDFAPALKEFFGAAAGLSASVITRLTSQWQADREAFMARSLADRDYVYVWADGVHFNVRLAEERLCTLVVVGVRSDGAKELVAVADGLRESTESWAELLRDLRRRGMQAPVLAVGDGALGLWAALRDVFPATRAQRCWVHKTANVLAALPKSVHPGARRALAKVTDDAEALLAFYDYPAEHWVHLRTTNPVESTFATVRLRTRVTKGPGNKQAGLAMAFKLLEAAEQRWRSVNGPHLVALVRAGAVFRKGVLIARPEQDQEAAA